MFFRSGLSHHIQTSASLMAALLLTLLMFWVSCGTVLTPQHSLVPETAPLNLQASGLAERTPGAGLISLTVLGPLGAYDLDSVEPGPQHTLNRLRTAGWKPGALNIAVLASPVLEACAGYNPHAIGWGRALSVADVLHFVRRGVNVLGLSNQSAHACRTPAGQADKTVQLEETVVNRLSRPENNLIVHAAENSTSERDPHRPVTRMVSMGPAGSFTLAFAAFKLESQEGMRSCRDQKCDQLLHKTAILLRETPADLKVVTLMGQTASALGQATDLIRHFGVNLVITYPASHEEQGAPAQWKPVTHAGQQTQGIVASGLNILNDPKQKLQWFQADFDLQARAFLRPRFSN